MESFHTEPVRGVIGNLGALSHPGMEVGRMMVHGELPWSPVQHLGGMRPTEAGLGTMTWEMPVTPWLQDRYGVIWGGVYALFADAVVGTSLQTGLPPGKLVATSELALSYVRPATLESGNFIGRGETIHLGREVGLSEAKIEDRHGRLLAYASTRCIVIDLPVDPNMPLMDIPDAIDDPPDPYLREVPDHVTVNWEELGALSPAEVFDKVWKTGEIGVGPVVRLTGHRGLEMGDGTYTLEWPASPWFSAGGPAMYGGAIGWGLDTAIEGAIFSTLDPGEFNASLDLHVRYFRPPMLDNRMLRVRAEVQHRGKRTRVATAEMIDADGNRVALATGSAFIIPDGIAHFLSGGSPAEIVPEVGGYDR